MTLIMNGFIGRKNMNDRAYKIAPKGLVYLALVRANLIESYEDARFEKFWNDFETSMKKYGYLREGDWD